MREARDLLTPHLCDHDRNLLALLVDSDLSAPFDCRFFEGLVQRLPEIRTASFAEDPDHGSLQMAFNRLQLLLVLMGRNAIRAECRASHPRLLGRVSFLCRVLPQLAQVNPIHAAGRIHCSWSGPASAKRYTPLSTIEHLIGKDILEELSPGDREADFSLELDPENAEVAFAKELQRIITASALTHQQFAERFHALGISKSWVSQACSGLRLPSGRYRPVIATIAAEYERPELLKYYALARKTRAKEKPLSANRDFTPKIEYLALVEPEWELLEKTADAENLRAHGCTLAPATKKIHRNQVASLILAAVASRDGPPGEKGLGLDTLSLSITVLARPDVLDMALANAAARRNASSGVLANADKLLAGTVAMLTRPHEGALWLCAKEVTMLNPDAASGLITQWPKNSGPDGQKCSTPTERIRAQCFETFAHASAIASKADKAPVSGSHLETISSLYTKFNSGMSVIFAIANHACPHRPPVTPEKIVDAMVCNFLAGAMQSPARLGDALFLQFHHVGRRPDGSFAEYQQPTQKTGRFATGKAGMLLLYPGLSRFLFPYHDWRIHQKPEGPYFIRPDGRPYDQASFRYALDKFFDRKANKVFPVGFHPHDPRYIVMTDACQAYGRRTGEIIGGEALRNCGSYTSGSYCVLKVEDCQLEFEGTPSIQYLIKRALTDSKHILRSHLCLT